MAADMMYRLLVWLFVAVVSHSAFAGFSKVEHGELANGMHVYVFENHRIPAVMHTVWYRVGGVDDPVGYSGLAHYLEHLMFKGTAKFTDMSSSVSGVGGIFNAGTSSDFTMYYEMVRKENLPLVMEIEADRMRGLKITTKGAFKEKNIVLEERKMRVENRAEALLDEEMRHAFFHNNYGRPVVGWENDISAFDDKVARRFYNKFYHPDNAYLLVVGDTTFVEVMKLAEQYYGSIKPNGLKSSVPKLPPRVEWKRSADATFALVSSKVSEKEMVFWYRAPSRITGSDSLPVALAVNILGGGLSSRLYTSLVRDKKLAVSASASYQDLVYGDTYVEIRVLVKPEVSLDVVGNEVRSLLQSFTSVGISEDELAGAKYRYRAEKVYDIDSLESVAYFYGSHLILGVPPEEVEDSYRKVDDIDVASVNAAAGSVFSDGKQFIGCLIPKDLEEGQGSVK